MQHLKARRTASQALQALLRSHGKFLQFYERNTRVRLVWYFTWVDDQNAWSMIPSFLYVQSNKHGLNFVGI